MTEQQGFAEPAPPAPDTDSAGLPGTGPVVQDPQPAEPVTVASGAAAGSAEPVWSTGSTGEALTVQPEPVPVAEQKAAGVPPEETVTLADQRAGTPPPNLPPVDADPQEVAEEAAAAEPEQAEAVSSTTPEPVPPPFIPSDGVPGWLREVLTWLHERISNLEG